MWEPVWQQVSLEYEGKTANFDSIRVDNLAHMRINGRPIGSPFEKFAQEEEEEEEEEGRG